MLPRYDEEMVHVDTSVMYNHSAKQYKPTTITVYKDHPEWDKREKWWMMPNTLLSELFVARYECGEELPTREDIAFVEKQHPGCVYIY